jgi:hypothetical protein
MEHILTSESYSQSYSLLGFYKIIRKAKRKLSGKEQLHENNDLTESEHANGATGKKNV